MIVDAKFLVEGEEGVREGRGAGLGDRMSNMSNNTFCSQHPDIALCLSILTVWMLTLDKLRQASTETFAAARHALRLHESFFAI